MLVEEKVLPKDWPDIAVQEQKKEKVRWLMNYSRGLKTLQDTLQWSAEQ